jgi:hypothetical protein
MQGVISDSDRLSPPCVRSGDGLDERKSAHSWPIQFGVKVLQAASDFAARRACVCRIALGEWNL